MDLMRIANKVLIISGRLLTHAGVITHCGVKGAGCGGTGCGFEGGVKVGGTG